MGRRVRPGRVLTGMASSRCARRARSALRWAPAVRAFMICVWVVGCITLSLSRSGIGAAMKTERANAVLMRH